MGGGRERQQGKGVTHHVGRMEWFQTSELFGLVCPRHSTGFSVSAISDDETLFSGPCQFFSHLFPPSLGSVPIQQVRQEQDGELVVAHILKPEMLKVDLAVRRVSTSSSTTSRRATAPPPRARTLTCSYSSRCVPNYTHQVFLSSFLYDSCIASWRGVQTQHLTRLYRVP